MRGVFDTNVVVSTLVFGRSLAWLRGQWARGAITPIVCRETILELLRVLAYPKCRLTAEERETLLEDYLPHAEIATLPNPPPPLPVTCRDRDDAVSIALAITAGADCLVSRDSDLAGLRAAAPVPILSAGELRARCG